jgi:hypothetical protein
MAETLAELFLPDSTTDTPQIILTLVFPVLTQRKTRR